MVNHGYPWLTMGIHGQPWISMVNHPPRGGAGCCWDRKLSGFLTCERKGHLQLTKTFLPVINFIMYTGIYIICGLEKHRNEIPVIFVRKSLKTDNSASICDIFLFKMDA